MWAGLCSGIQIIFLPLPHDKACERQISFNVIFFQQWFFFSLFTSKILANGCKGPGSDSAIHGFKVSPVSYIAISSWVSRFLLLANPSKKPMVFPYVVFSSQFNFGSCGFPLIVPIGWRWMPAPALGKGGQQVLCLSGEEASLVWGVPLRPGCRQGCCLP